MTVSSTDARRLASLAANEKLHVNSAYFAPDDKLVATDAALENAHTHGTRSKTGGGGGKLEGQNGETQQAAAAKENTGQLIQHSTGKGYVPPSAHTNAVNCGLSGTS